MEEEIDRKDLKENDIIRFGHGNRFYYGIVKQDNVVLVNNHSEQFRLKNISHITKIDDKKVKGGIQMTEEIEEVKEKKEKVSINADRLVKVKKLVAFAETELKIEKKELVKVFSRAYNFCRGK